MRAVVVAAVVAVAVAVGCGPAGRPAPAEPEPDPEPAVLPIKPMPPPEPEPAEPKDPLPGAVERSVSLYEAIAAVEPATPCPQAAATIERLIAERADALRTVGTAARGERHDDVDALYERAAGRLSSALAQIEALSQRCAGEPAVGAALARLSGDLP